MAIDHKTLPKNEQHLHCSDIPSLGAAFWFTSDHVSILNTTKIDGNPARIGLGRPPGLNNKEK